MEENLQDQTDQSTELAVRSIWSKSLKVPSPRLGQSTNVFDVADSITISRLRAQVKRELRVALSVQDMLDHPKIAQQAQMIHNRERSVTGESLRRFREGPPQFDDVDGAGDLETYDEIKEKAGHVLSSISLSWDNDVEDVLPMYGMGQFILGEHPGQTWILQFVLVARKADPNALRAARETALSSFPLLRSSIMPQVGGHRPQYLAIRPSSAWFEQCIRVAEPTETPETLRTLRTYDDWLISIGPVLLFRAVIVPRALARPVSSIPPTMLLSMPSLSLCS